MFTITMVVLGIIDKIKGKKKKQKPNPLTKGIIKYKMVDLGKALGGPDLEIFDKEVISRASRPSSKSNNKLSMITKKKSVQGGGGVWRVWNYSKRLKSNQDNRKNRKRLTRKNKRKVSGSDSEMKQSNFDARSTIKKNLGEEEKEMDL